MDYHDFVLTTMTAALGWLVVRQEKFLARVVRVETIVKNGITQTVSEIREMLEKLRVDVEQHTVGEEERIIAAVRRARRDARMRTRRTDSAEDHED